MKAKNQLLFFWVLLGGIFAFFSSAKAIICPVCTIAVAGGLGLSRWLGIDDFISAVWIGGLALSITVWSWNYLKEKHKLNAVTGFSAFFFIYFSILFPLYKMRFFGISGNTLWGKDKIIIGIIAGTIAFWLGAFLHSWLKKRNAGKVYFPFQRVVFPFALLLAASVIYYIGCKCV